MSMQLINGDGAGIRPLQHYDHLCSMAAAVTRFVSRGQFFVAGCVTKRLTAIERGFIADRMLRSGIDADTVLRILS